MEVVGKSLELLAHAALDESASGTEARRRLASSGAARALASVGARLGGSQSSDGGEQYARVADSLVHALSMVGAASPRKQSPSSSAAAGRRPRTARGRGKVDPYEGKMMTRAEEAELGADDDDDQDDDDDDDDDGDDDIADYFADDNDKGVGFTAPAPTTLHHNNNNNVYNNLDDNSDNNIEGYEGDDMAATSRTVAAVKIELRRAGIPPLPRGFGHAYLARASWRLLLGAAEQDEENLSRLLSRVPTRRLRRLAVS